MADGPMTPTTAAAHIGEVWIPEVIRAAEFDTVIAGRVFRDWKYLGHGDVYHVPRIPNIESQTKTAGLPWTPKVYTDTKQSLIIDTHTVAGFQIEDITTLLSNTNLRREMQQGLGYSLARSVDVNLATIPQNFESIGTLGTPLLYSELTTGWQMLTEAGVSVNPSEVTAFLTPAAIRGLLNQDIVINGLYRSEGKRAVETANVGTLLNMSLIQSNLIRRPAAGQSESWMMHKRAIALMMAMRPSPIADFLGKDIAWVVGMQQVYGFTEVNRYEETPGSTTATNDWAVLIETV